jgi:hypothetical protein
MQERTAETPAQEMLPLTGVPASKTFMPHPTKLIAINRQLRPRSGPHDVINLKFHAHAAHKYKPLIMPKMGNVRI